MFKRKDRSPAGNQGCSDILSICSDDAEILTASKEAVALCIEFICKCMSELQRPNKWEYVYGGWVECAPICMLST